MGLQPICSLQKQFKAMAWIWKHDSHPVHVTCKCCSNIYVSWIVMVLLQCTSPTRTSPASYGSNALSKGGRKVIRGIWHDLLNGMPVGGTHLTSASNLQKVLFFHLINLSHEVVVNYWLYCTFYSFMIINDVRFWFLLNFFIWIESLNFLL